MKAKLPVTVTQALGNLPVLFATYYSNNKKPEVKLSEGQRQSFITFKTTVAKDKLSATLRQSISVLVNRVTRTQILAVAKGDEMIQAMLDEFQDSELRKCADGLVSFADCELADKLVAAFHDTSRVNGNRVTTESIMKWFEENCTEFMVERLVAKFPKFDTDKIAAIVKQYQVAIGNLPKYGFPITKPVTAQLVKFHAEFPYSEDDEMKEYITERLEKLENHHNQQNLIEHSI